MGALCVVIGGRSDQAGQAVSDPAAARQVPADVRVLPGRDAAQAPARPERSVAGDRSETGRRILTRCGHGAHAKLQRPCLRSARSSCRASTSTSRHSRSTPTGCGTTTRRSSACLLAVQGAGLSKGGCMASTPAHVDGKRIAPSQVLRAQLRRATRREPRGLPHAAPCVPQAYRQRAHPSAAGPARPHRPPQQDGPRQGRLGSTS